MDWFACTFDISDPPTDDCDLLRVTYLQFPDLIGHSHQKKIVFRSLVRETRSMSDFELSIEGAYSPCLLIRCFQGGGDAEQQVGIL